MPKDSAILKQIISQTEYQNFLSKVPQGQFLALLSLLEESSSKDPVDNAKKILSLIDTYGRGPNDHLPLEITNTITQLARNRVFTSSFYKKLREWYSALEASGLKFSSDSQNDIQSKPSLSEVVNRIKTETEDPSVDMVTTTVPENSGKEDTILFSLDPEKRIPEPFDPAKENIVSGTPTKNNREKRATYYLEKSSPLEEKSIIGKGGTIDKTADDLEDDGTVNILSVSPANTKIYRTTPEKNPELFLVFQDSDGSVSHISKRILNPLWKPTHPSSNPYNGRNSDFMGLVLDFLVSGPHTYEDLLRFIDDTDNPRLIYTARRIYWMIVYGEFLRFSLVSEFTKSPDTFRLVQRWVTHPVVKFVREQWEQANGKI